MAVDFKKLKDAVTDLVKDGDVEAVKKLGGVITLIDDAEKERTDLVKSNNDLRDDYIKMVRNSSTHKAEEHTEENHNEEKSLEDCLREAQRNAEKNSHK